MGENGPVNVETYIINADGELIPASFKEFMDIYNAHAATGFESAIVRPEHDVYALEIDDKRLFYAIVTGCGFVRRWRNHLKAREMMHRSDRRRRRIER